MSERGPAGVPRNSSGAHESRRARQGSCSRPSAGSIQHGTRPEVSQFGPSIGGEQHVRRLDVAVDQARFMPAPSAKTTWRARGVERSCRLERGRL